MVAVGVFLDRVLSPAVKAATAGSLKTFNSSKWYNYSALFAYKVYVYVFDISISSSKFWIRCLAVYVTLMGGGIAFLFLLFPSTFQSITSVWSLGEPLEKLAWTAFLVIGYFLFVLSAAQSLIFLEFLKSTSRVSRFFTIAYADVVSSISLAIIASGFALYLYTLMVINNQPRAIPIQVNFSQMERNFTADLSRLVGRNPRDPDVKRMIQQKEDFIFFEVNFEYIGNDTTALAYKKDFDLTIWMIKQGLLPSAQYDEKAKVIRFFDDLGRTTDYTKHEYLVSGRTSAYFDLRKKSLDKARGEFCSNFGVQAERMPVRYVNFYISRKDKAALDKACMNGSEVRIAPYAWFNDQNISHANLLRFWLISSFDHFVISLTDGFSSYLGGSPYLPVAESAGIGWRFTHLIGDSDHRPHHAFDDMLRESLVYQLGAKNFVLDRGAPGGSLFVALMSPSLLSGASFFILLVSSPIAAALDRFSGRHSIDFDNNPFTLILLGLGITLSIIWTFLRLSMSL